MKKTVLALLFALLNFTLQAQNIYIPDANFKATVIAEGIDIDGDGQISLTEAHTVTGTLNLDSKNISDLTGINYFINIDILRATNNNLSVVDLSNLTNLSGLILSNNDITDIDLSNNTALSTLHLSNNLLTSINLTNNAALQILNLNLNNLISINLYNNSLLENVYLSENSLDNLIMANHPNLHRLDCDENAMSGMLNLNSATSLVTLHCENNQLENSDLFLGNIGIQSIYANDNLLSGEMDFSILTNLLSLNIANNTGIENINLRNGNNGTITLFDATGCTSLLTVCVEDATAAITASGWSVDNTSVYSTCRIEIPDSNFEQALMDLGMDTDLDTSNPSTPNGYIDASNPEGVTYLPLSNKSISIFTGINYFTDLEVLIANNNQLTSIDVSALTHLKVLNLKNNQLDSYYVTLPSPSDLRNLFVDNNTEFVGGNHFNNVIANQNLLEKLTLANNNAQLIELTNFPNLLEFNCTNNFDIDTLDVSNSPLLRLLVADNCSIATLDVSSIQSLDELRVQNNGMTSLIMGVQPHFNSLRCSNNNLTDINVSAMSHLGFFTCANNQFTNLSVSNNHELAYLDISNNPSLVSLNLKNGNNATVLNNVYATNLGTGCCIQVDDDLNFPSAWVLDTTDTTISNDCATNLTYVPDDNFEQALIDLGYDTTLDNFVLTANISGLTSLSVYNKNIADLTGIEDFTALISLNVYNNNLSSIDVYNNTNLTFLNCASNDIGNINITNNTALTDLYIYNTLLTSIDLSGNTALEKLYCNYTSLTELDLSMLGSLTLLSCSNNTDLAKLNLKNGNNLNVTSFNTSNCSVLSCINVDDATYSSANWTDIDATSSFDEYCGQTYVPDDNFEQALIDLGYDDTLDDYVLTLNIDTLTNLTIYDKNIADASGIEDFVALETLSFEKNNLITLDVSMLPSLTYLDCARNDLTTLSLSISLEYLFAEYNDLVTLDLTGFDNLSILNCYNNNLTTLNLPTSNSLLEINVEHNDLTTINITNKSNLTKLEMVYNQLTNIDLSDAIDLTYLDLGHNQLGSIDVANNTDLTTLGLYANSISSIDISALTNLEIFSCSENNITNLDVSNNTLLSMFEVQFNQLETLDVSNSPNLIYFKCNDNQLTQLNIKNGNNSILIGGSGTYNTIPNFLNNSDLTCIEVDDPVWSTANWTDVDATASYNIDCSMSLNVNIVGNGSVVPSPTGSIYDNGTLVTLTATPDVGWMFTGWSGDLTDTINPANITMDADKSLTATFTEIVVAQTYVPDDNFEQALIDLGYDDILDDYVVTANISSVTALDVNTKSIADLTGIEDFIALTNLSCSHNSLTSLSINTNVNLTTLECNSNSLSSLDVSDNIVLNRLDCSGNSLTAINVSNNIELTFLSCYINNITNLDVSNNIDLSSVHCAFNSLSVLDFSANVNLSYMKCQNNTLTFLNLQNGNNATIDDTHFNALNNPDLTCIQVDNVVWSTSNWTSLDTTSSFSEDCSVVPQYSLTVNITGNGSVVPSPTGSIYDNGTVVTLTATPNAGWVFTGWSGDLTGTANPANITMDVNKIVTALFTDTSSVQDEAMGQKIRIYPNPTASLINIEIDESLQIKEISVFNIEGKKLLEQIDDRQISLQHFERGLYIIKIQTDKGIVTKRVIKK